MSERTCIDCKFWYFDGGSPTYSALTVGENWSSWCMKKHWEADGTNEDSRSYRSKLLTARMCQDFVLADYP
jgi:hypothetical protein